MTETTTPAAAPAEAKTSTCRCGCGEPVARLFKQGHDQRLISLLAQDVVLCNVWEGRCLGILKAAQVKKDQQEKIDIVADHMSRGLSEALSSKFVNAAHRQWELQKGKAERDAAKAAKKAAKPAKAKKGKSDTPSVEAGGAPGPITAPAEPKLITKAAATNADVDAAEAAMDDVPQLGTEIRVLVGKRKRNARVHGMSQAGKVTAILLVTNGKETVKTEGFTVLGTPEAE